MAVAACAGWLAGRLHDGTTVPMSAMIAAMLFIAAIAFLLLVPRRHGEPG
jgi:hypothetical protein